MAPENLLLAALPPGVLEHLQPRLEPVPLPKGRALFEAGEAIRHAYFPTSGLVSLLGTTADGESVELATVARDGLLGLPLILHADAAPHAATVQMAGSALRIHARDLDVALRQSVVLHSVLLHYTHGLLVEISRAVVCHHFHSDLPRLCRWLLIAIDRLHCQTLDVTHDALALAIGVPRTQVTCAALELQDAGAIRYRRGRIHILNRTLDGPPGRRDDKAPIRRARGRRDSQRPARQPPKESRDRAGSHRPRSSASKPPTDSEHRAKVM
jgi:CRP-like cAMP-binding protein